MSQTENKLSEIISLDPKKENIDEESRRMTVGDFASLKRSSKDGSTERKSSAAVNKIQNLLSKSKLSQDDTPSGETFIGDTDVKIDGKDSKKSSYGSKAADSPRASLKRSSLRHSRGESADENYVTSNTNSWQKENEKRDSLKRFRKSFESEKEQTEHEDSRKSAQSQPGSLKRSSRSHGRQRESSQDGSVKRARLETDETGERASDESSERKELISLNRTSQSYYDASTTNDTETSTDLEDSKKSASTKSASLHRVSHETPTEPSHELRSSTQITKSTQGSLKRAIASLEHRPSSEILQETEATLKSAPTSLRHSNATFKSTVREQEGEINDSRSSSVAKRSLDETRHDFDDVEKQEEENDDLALLKDSLKQSLHELEELEELELKNKYSTSYIEQTKDFDNELASLRYRSPRALSFDEELDEASKKFEKYEELMAAKTPSHKSSRAASTDRSRSNARSTQRITEEEDHEKPFFTRQEESKRRSRSSMPQSNETGKSRHERFSKSTRLSPYEEYLARSENKLSETESRMSHSKRPKSRLSFYSDMRRKPSEPVDDSEKEGDDDENKKSSASKEDSKKDSQESKQNKEQSKSNGGPENSWMPGFMSKNPDDKKSDEGTESEIGSDDDADKDDDSDGSEKELDFTLPKMPDLPDWDLQAWMDYLKEAVDALVKGARSLMGPTLDEVIVDTANYLNIIVEQEKSKGSKDDGKGSSSGNDGDDKGGPFKGIFGKKPDKDSEETTESKKSWAGLFGRKSSTKDENEEKKSGIFGRKSQEKDDDTKKSGLFGFGKKSGSNEDAENKSKDVRDADEKPKSIKKEKDSDEE